jgi:hypothetical protein
MFNNSEKGSDEHAGTTGIGESIEIGGTVHV